MLQNPEYTGLEEVYRTKTSWNKWTSRTEMQARIRMGWPLSFMDIDAKQSVSDCDT
jgi:hypothetical protein